MNRDEILQDEQIGFLHPSIDAHTLGISQAAQILSDCDYKVIIAGDEVCRAIEDLSTETNADYFISWLQTQRICHIGFSYRLDPQDAVKSFDRFYHFLRKRSVLKEQGGQIRRIYFAGLPASCEQIQARFGERVTTFAGDESIKGFLCKMGVPETYIPRNLYKSTAYDDLRLKIAEEYLSKDEYLSVRPVDRSGYEEFGTFRDTVVKRLFHGARNGLPPLMRVHVGPYYSDMKRHEMISLFNSWLQKLSKAGFLDIVSIGSSQLSQSRFGENWQGAPNGGGVPVNSAEEYYSFWENSRPMLLRTYAGTKNIPELARLYEKTINIAWHALSFWWFNKIDGRGPLPLSENLIEHFKTVRYIAESGKPLEANVPHHFAFRGADDVAYVLSGFLAAKAAKKSGIRYYITQIMLNTPSRTWGIQDLAKARALQYLVRTLEDEHFSSVLQPRAGLDYFSHDLEKAKRQLFAVTALMDDIEPHEVGSPHIIHVVSYSEASHLADPDVINDSIKITRYALEKYRELKKRGVLEDLTIEREIGERTQELLNEVSVLIREIESTVPNPYSPEGFYEIFKRGYLPVPYLWEEREAFPAAIHWNTRLIDGGVKVVNQEGTKMSIQDRIHKIRCFV